MNQIYQNFIPKNSRVQEIGCGKGQLLTNQGWVSPDQYDWELIVLKAGIVDSLPKILENGTFIEISDTDIGGIVPPETPLNFLQNID